MSPFTKGLTVALGVSLSALIGAASLILPSAYRDASSGWNLVTVMVANRDLPAGTELTYQDLAQRNLPEQFITRAHLTVADVELVVGRKLPQELKAGETLVLSSFVAPPPADTACE